MDAKYIALIVFVAIIMAIVGAYAQGATLTLDPDSSTLDPDVNTVMTYVETWSSQPFSPEAIKSTPGYFGALFRILVMQHGLHSVFPEDSQWMWGWIVLWTPIIALVIFGIVVLFLAIIFRFIGT